MYPTYRKYNPIYFYIHLLVCLFFLSFADASSTNEAVHLQQRLKSLSSELVTLRNRLHVDNTNVDVTLTGDVTTGAAAAVNLVTSSNTTNLTNGPFVNHSNMQIGSSAIPITNKSNPKVSKTLQFYRFDFILIHSFIFLFMKLDTGISNDF